jgi:hypothetical protein
LHVLQEKYVFDIDVIDVDADEALVTRYDELVPVLVAKNGDADPVQLCHYFLDEIKVEAYLLLDVPR